MNHADEARRVITTMPSGDTLDQAYAYSQVHALLEIAEQMRIANLIALSESGRTTVNGARAALKGIYDSAGEDGTSNMNIRPEIAATLKIGETP